MIDMVPHIPGCRVCSGEFFSSPILTFPRSPASAQGFLTHPDQPAGDVDLLIHQCRFCGLVQHDLPAVSYYKDAIRAVGFSEEMRAFRKRQLNAWLSDTGLKKRRVLEIGSGNGEYLDLLKDAGASCVSGLEHSQTAVKDCLKRGLDVRQGFLDKSFKNPWSDGFDGFAIFSFLEHWPDLNESLRCLHGLLTNGATGLIEVPNFQFIVENHLYSEFTPDHIFYFDQKTLRAVLEINGFIVDAMESIWHNYIISAKVSKKPALDGSGFRQRQALVVKEIQHFVDRFKPNEVVIWGAGHQALAVMSMADLGDRISHVVDSAAFKQGKYTPGTKLLIKAPASLLDDKPKAMIIMAAGYSDEVLGVVRRFYQDVQHLAILRESGLEIIHREP
jgi:SAM-dependent methyltransferase